MGKLNIILHLFKVNPIRQKSTHPRTHQPKLLLKKNAFQVFNLNCQNSATNMSQEFESNGFSEGNPPKADSPPVDADGAGMLIESNYDKVTDNFDDMALGEDLLRGIYAYGFEKPSAIQQRAIVPCIAGHDVIAQAQSGTGKTATFAIAILEKIDTGLRECQALILAPTRELAQQIQKVVMSLGDYMGAQCHACIGGTSVREDMRKLDVGQHIVVG